MRITRRCLAAACLFLVAVPVRADPEGAIQRTGQAVDRGARRTGAALERGVHRTGAALQRAGNWTAERARRVGRRLGTNG